MSMDLCCDLVLGSVRLEIVVADAPSYIISKDWRITARSYLEWCKDHMDEYVYRMHRKRIGDAWRAADENHGTLHFYIN